MSATTSCFLDQSRTVSLCLLMFVDVSCWLLGHRTWGQHAFNTSILGQGFPLYFKYGFLLAAQLHTDLSPLFFVSSVCLRLCGCKLLCTAKRPRCHWIMHRRAHHNTRSLTFKKDCPLDHSYRVLAPGYNGFASINGREPQCPTPSAGEVCDVSVSELPSCSTIPAPHPVPNSSLVGHLNREHGSAQVALPLVYSASEIGASPIGDASDQVTDHNITVSSSYTTIAIGQLWTYSQEIGNVSTFGDLDHGAAIPTMGLGPVHPFHGHTPGQVIDSNAVWPELSSSLLPSRQQPHVSDDHISDNILLPLEQIRTEMAAPTQFLSSFTAQQINQWVASPISPVQLIRSVP
ncbi:hypothetical protein EDC04DRAFT_2039014 [Pisolithus marmoratus]|nr:hypothetical protein EDC04DRAFT_2039014 [Pisolithus marmoratus]